MAIKNSCMCQCLDWSYLAAAHWLYPVMWPQNCNQAHWHNPFDLKQNHKFHSHLGNNSHALVMSKPPLFKIKSVWSCHYLSFKTIQLHYYMITSLYIYTINFVKFLLPTAYVHSRELLLNCTVILFPMCVFIWFLYRWVLLKPDFLGAWKSVQLKHYLAYPIIIISLIIQRNLATKIRVKWESGLTAVRLKQDPPVHSSTVAAILCQLAILKLLEECAMPYLEVIGLIPHCSTNYN